jgi:diguanylate cyclase (GGDEF)-like protein
MDEPATIDSLTGALDRRSFAPGLAAALERARNSGVPLTLAIIDLDHFKSINDAFGHARGDQILREAAQRMQRTLRGTDRLYRYGGDEFVLTLQDASLEQAQALVERLMNAVRDDKITGNPPVRMTLSIGAASTDEFENEFDAQALFERADARLYQSKRQGRNRLRMRDAPAETVSGEERHGSRMLERDKALADIRTFLESLPARKRARLRVSGPPGSGRSRVLAEAGRHAALTGYEVMALQGRAGFALRTYAAILEARAAGGLWSELPHPLGGAVEFVPALARALDARGAAGLVLLVDGAEDIDRSTQSLLRAIIACADIVQVAVVACADGALPQSLDCGLDQETVLHPLTSEGTSLWLRGMLKWEPPAEFVAAFHGVSDGLPGAMARRLQRLRELNLLTPGAESWNLERAWYTSLEADAKSSARRVRNTPLPEEELIGREEELALIKQIFKSGGLLTLAAPGGMGKTRLALQAAAELAGDFADGINWVSLTGIESSELMLPALLQAINLRLQGGVAPRRILVERCSKSSMLLVLDGFDPMMHDLGLIEEMVNASPNLRLLVTSREELRLAAERALHLHGLDAGEHADANAASLGHAETLFLQQARKALPEFVPAEGDLPQISRICASVGGMPLAIRLAAAWVTVFNCTEIASRLEKDPEQANALSVINYFWSQLSESERQGARALAVCRGGFELSAAQKVAQVSPFFLSALVTKSFLVRNQGGRYDMQELLRQYSQRELTAHPQDWRKLRLVHGEYYLELVEQAATRWHGSEEIFWFARLTIELDNLRAALAAALEDGHVDQALRMIAALANFWIGRGLILEGLRWTELVLRQDDVVGNPYHAPAVAAHGKLYFWSGQPEQSVRAFEQGLCLAEEAGLTTAVAVCQAWLAASLFRRGRHADALPLGERALAVARDASLRGEHALCLLTLGGILLERGDQAGAREHLVQCLRMLDEQGDGRRRTIALIFFGMLEFRDGHLDDAKRTFIEAISFSLDNDDRLNYAFGLAHLGAVETAQGYRRDAHQHFAAAREILHQAGAYDWEALCLVHTAQAHLVVQDRAAARSTLEAALTCALDSRSVRRQLLVVAAYAQLAAAEGDANRARELAELVLAHPDRGAEASIPARAALGACGASREAASDIAAIPLAECLSRLKQASEVDAGT